MRCVRASRFREPSVQYDCAAHLLSRERCLLDEKIKSRRERAFCTRSWHAVDESGADRTLLAGDIWQSGSASVYRLESGDRVFFTTNETVGREA
jgi:hypothetical protein